jgi:23S rRNA pseudouridine955/2504/2580 synthase
VKKYYLALVEGIVEGPEIWEDSLVRDGAAGKTLIAEGPGCPRPVPAGGGNGCKGETPDAGGAFIGRAKPQRALTRVSPLKSLAAEKQGGGGASFPAGFSLILAEIETGRTHQIRAQAAARGHPLAGDKKYGGHYQPGGFLLHAWKLEFPDTPGRGLPRSITAPPPENFRARIRELFGEEI